MIKAINRRGAPNNNTASYPAPTGGWNSRDSIAQLKPKYAQKLTNWFPTTSDLMIRKGSEAWATGMTGQINSLMAYNGTNRKIFAAVGVDIFDVTSSGAVGAASLTGLGSDKFVSVNITTSGGTLIGMANGVDSVYIYDGTAWTAIT